MTEKVTNDPNFSRRYPHTFTAVEWAMIFECVEEYQAGYCLDRGTPAMGAYANVRKELLKLVCAVAQLEPLGSGLDHPDNAHLLPNPGDLPAC